MYGPGSRLVACLFILLASTLALAACNSRSVSANQPRPSSSASAETQSMARPSSGMRAQRMVDAAIANAR
jgi:hypothetical protein